MVTFKTFFNLILEDLKSSINQANKILTSNEFSPEEASQAVDKIKGIMDEVGRGVSNQQKRFNTDSNIPILSYILLALKDAGGDPYAKLKREYQTYLASEEATNKKILTIAFDKLRNEIQGKKLFKPSPEKTQIIVSWGTNLIEEIHKYIKADKTESPVVRSNEDVVYENNDIVVYRADSKNKCIAYGAGSNLCISVKGGGNYYWAYRMGEMRQRQGLDDYGMTTYFVFWKDTNERILIDALGDEDGPANKYSWNNIEKDGTYDNVDADITPEELIKMHPELQEPFSNNVFQFVPYGEDEKRFKYIQDHISDISNSELKTLKDYEMFLEGADPDDYVNNIFIRFRTWSHLIESNKLSEEEARTLVKKYAGLNFNLDIETQQELLSPSDRNWYLNTVIPKREDAEDILGYMRSVRWENIPDKLYEILSVMDGGDEIYTVLGDVLNTDDFYLNNKFSPNEAYNIIIGNINDELFAKLQKLIEMLDDPGALLQSAIDYYKRSNKKIPKQFYKLIVQYPDASYKAALYWKKIRNNDIPNILIKSAIKDPVYALKVAETLFEFDNRGYKNIPDYIKRAVFKDPKTKYQFIDRGVDSSGFENYPSSEIVDLFSKLDNGYRYAQDKEGFGVFNRKNNSGDQRVRRAIYKNIMNNSKKAYDHFFNYRSELNKNGDFYKMLRRSSDKFIAERGW
jgi:hypothetical protein